MPLADYVDKGLFAPAKIAAAWRTTSTEVAASAGLGRDAVQRRERVTSDLVQSRLRQMVKIVGKVEPRPQSRLCPRPAVG